MIVYIKDITTKNLLSTSIHIAIETLKKFTQKIKKLAIKIKGKKTSLKPFQSQLTLLK